MAEKPQVFLSHAGEDHEQATELASRIKKALKALGHAVKIFNTSEPHYRFQSLHDPAYHFIPGKSFEEMIEPYIAELKEYLRSNLLASDAYILFCTENVLEKERAAQNRRWALYEFQKWGVSNWIDFEIDVAAQEAQQRRLFFFPCVPSGMELGRLPKGAIRYQGVKLESDRGFRILVSGLSRAIETKQYPDCSR